MKSPAWVNLFFCGTPRPFLILMLLLLALLASGPSAMCGAVSSQFVNSGSPVGSQEVRPGTILKLRMDTTLSSARTNLGETFTMTVYEPVPLTGRQLIPVGTRAEGHVTGVERARRNQTGTISIEFDRLIFANGRSFPIDGQLTSADPNVTNQVDAEGRSTGGATTKRNILFVGSGAGLGAVIGAVAGGGKGAAIGAGAGAGAGLLGALLSQGYEAEVRAGTLFNLELTSPLRMTEGEPGDRELGASPDRDRYPGGFGKKQPDYTDLDFVKRAQVKLRDSRYYGSTVDGLLSPATLVAIRNFQRDQRLEQTSQLDLPTVRALGLVDENGDPTERNSDRFESPGRGRGNQNGMALTLKTQASRMLATVRSQLLTTGRSNRSAVWQLNETEAGLYSSLAALSASTQFYAELVDARSSEAAQRGAAEVLVRNARRVSRHLLNSGRSTMSIRNDFEEFDVGLKQLNERYRFNSGNDETSSQ